MKYKITNIEYGIGPWGTEVLYGEIGNPHPGESENNIHSVTLLEGENGEKILVDTGVDTEDPAKDALWSELIDTCKGVVWALAQVGVTPDDIDTVILTHAHLDHIGGMLQFKNAQFYIQQKEFEAWEAMAADPRYAQLTIPAAMASDYPPIRALIDEGRVTLFNGDVVNFRPGISLHVAYECHSVAEQIVVVDTARGTCIIGGDVACRPANIFGAGEWTGFLAPTLGRSGSARKVFETYRWIADTLDGDASRLVLTHDVTMRDRFDNVATDEEGLFVHSVA